MNKAWETDVLVIGAAALGLSAACAYRSRHPESRVTIIEKGARKNYRDHVGSQGNLRGSRSVMQSDMMHGFIAETWNFMHALEIEEGERILTPTSEDAPYLMLSEKSENAAAIIEGLRDRGIDHQFMPIAEAHERYDLNLPVDYAGVINALDSKRINLGNYIESMRQQLIQHGVREAFEVTVTSAVRQDDSSYQVSLSNGEIIHTNDVIICAGEDTSRVLGHFLNESQIPERLKPQDIRKIPQRTLHLRLPAHKKLYTIYNLDIGPKGALGFYMFPELVQNEAVLKIGYDPMRKDHHDEDELNRQTDLMLRYVAQVYGIKKSEIGIMAEHECYYMIDATHEICAGRIANSHVFVGSNFIGYGVMAGYGAFHCVFGNEAATSSISPDRTIQASERARFHQTYNAEQSFPNCPAIPEEC